VPEPFVTDWQPAKSASEAIVIAACGGGPAAVLDEEKKREREAAAASPRKPNARDTRPPSESAPSTP
jgi:hypothetical protein